MHYCCHGCIHPELYLLFFKHCGTFGIIFLPLIPTSLLFDVFKGEIRVLTTLYLALKFILRVLLYIHGLIILCSLFTAPLLYCLSSFKCIVLPFKTFMLLAIFLFLLSVSHLLRCSTVSCWNLLPRLCFHTVLRVSAKE